MKERGDKYMRFKDWINPETGELWVNGYNVGVPSGSKIPDAENLNDDGYDRYRSVNHTSMPIKDAADKYYEEKYQVIIEED